MKIRGYLFIYVLFLSTCQSRPKEEQLFVQPKKWRSDSDSKKIKDRINKGGIEYFSINGVQFRFKKSSQANNLYNIEVNKNDKWFMNLSLPMPKDKFFLTNDFDLDKYFDLLFLEYGQVNVYFFDKTQQCFISQPMQFSSDFALLDSSQLIYGANGHKLINDTNDRNSAGWNIDIFSIKGRKKTALYKAKLFHKNNSNNGGFQITTALLYECKNGIEKDTVLIDKLNINRQFGDFSLSQFMKDIAHGKTYR